MVKTDEWRPECWKMIKERSDLHFLFLTKRINRFMDCIPADWGEGYNNVTVGCTIENQEKADKSARPLDYDWVLKIRKQCVEHQGVLSKVDKIEPKNEIPYCM